MKVKICKICSKSDDGSVEFIKDERKCIPCRNEQNRLRYKNDPEYRANKLKSLKNDRTKAWYKIKYPEYIKKYHKDNWDSIKKHKRKYVINNSDKVNEICNRRRANKLKRMPKWRDESDRLKIQCYYSLSKRLTKCLGIPHNVDHILPLQGVKVSGLHTFNNLQVIPASVNFRKNNKFDV